MKHYLIVGQTGMLGGYLVNYLARRVSVSSVNRGHRDRVSPTFYDGIMTPDLSRISAAIRDADVVVNAAGSADVQAHQSGSESALRSSILFPSWLSKQCADFRKKLIHISTDHLFYKNSIDTWASEQSLPTVINAYSQAKLLAETLVSERCPESLIIRASFFGPSATSKESFSDFIINATRKNRPISLYSDVFFNPLSMRQVAEMILNPKVVSCSGILNLGSAACLSKFDFAKQLTGFLGLADSNLIPTKYNDHQQSNLLCRPLNMCLTSSRLPAIIGRPNLDLDLEGALK